ncbi:MAG: hypothetical protein WCP20_20390, partial [Desulfuromonadales bacterium]
MCKFRQLIIGLTLCVAMLVGMAISVAAATPTTLASGLGNAYFVAVDDTNAYVIDRANGATGAGAVYQVNLSSGNKIALGVCRTYQRCKKWLPNFR